MQLTCRRCNGSFSAPGSTVVPCPACGSIEVSARSPLAATTERPARAFSNPVSQPVTAPPPQPASPVPYGHAPLAHSPSYPAPPPQQAIPAPVPSHYAAPIAAPPPTAYAPYAAPAPVHVIIQNQIGPVQPYAPMPYGMMPYTRRKDAGVATLLSFFLPGAGQLYNGQIGKGLAFLLVTLFVNVPLMLIGIGFVTGLVTWIWSMIDAHSSAERINRGEIVV